MVNDPGPIRELAERLDDLTTAVARSSRFEDLRENLRSSWKLKPESYLDLKAATDTPERRDNLHVQIAAAFEPLLRDGVLGPGTLAGQRGIEPRALGPQRGRASPSRPGSLPRDRVVPERIIKPDGPVAQEFRAAFTTPARRPDPLRLGRRPARSLATSHFRGRGDGPAAGRGTQPRPRRSTPTRAARCWSKPGPDDRRRAAHPASPRARRRDGASSSFGDQCPARLGNPRAGRRALLPGGILRLPARAAVRPRTSPRRHDLRPGDRWPWRSIRLLAAQTWNAEIVPVAIVGMIVAIAYNPSFAMMVTFGLSLSDVHHARDPDPAFPGRDGRDRRRRAHLERGPDPHQADQGRRDRVARPTSSSPGRPGLWQDQPLELVRDDSLWRAGWGLMAGFLLGGSLPFIENALGIVTGISLLELGDNTHPLLQELVRRAPGTHNHSITVGAIAESAAERIGADALLVRIGAYFHDIGKMLKPHYFVENQVGPDQSPRQAGAGDEHAHHHRPRQGRSRPGPAAPPSRADHRLDRAAPRHDAGRVLLPRGQQAQRQQPRRRRRSRRAPIAIPGPSRRPARRPS